MPGRFEAPGEDAEQDHREARDQQSCRSQSPDGRDVRAHPRRGELRLLDIREAGVELRDDQAPIESEEVGVDAKEALCVGPRREQLELFGLERGEVAPTNPSLPLDLAQLDPLALTRRAKDIANLDHTALRARRDLPPIVPQRARARRAHCHVTGRITTIARVPPPELIDLRHQGHERTIAAYLLDTEDGPALFDCGPATTVDALKTGLAEHSLRLADIRHLLLSHIHLDHAGAAGVLVREHPALQVHVSGIGAPHLIDPQRLERSARRLYGDTFDTLWGELAAVPTGNVNVVGDRVVGLECWPAPGHAKHHVCYLDCDGTLYAGDAAGVRVLPGRYVMPPTPPPEVDVELWQETIAELERRDPERLALIHFGVVDEPQRHLAELRLALYDWADFVKGGASEDEFVAYVRAELRDGGERTEDYDHAIPLWQAYRGLKRWADLSAAA